MSAYPSSHPNQKESTYNTSVILKVQENTVESLPGLGLADDDGGVDLLSEFGLSLLDRGHDHVADAAGGQSVQAGTETLDGDDVEVAGTRVVGAVHDGTAAAPVSRIRFGMSVCGCRVGTYTGRPRVILSLPPGAPRLFETESVCGSAC